MNKKQLAILSIGNILHKDEGIALYASKYLESNYSFQPSVDIINGSVEGMDLLDVFMTYKEIVLLDVIGIEDAPGSMYQFPMSTFRGFSTGEEADDKSVIACLNTLERRGEILPEVSLHAIVPESIDAEVGLSASLFMPFEAYILMIVKALESKGITCEAKAEKQTIESVIESFVS
jgi:hydrogenase maturation protease